MDGHIKEYGEYFEETASLSLRAIQFSMEAGAVDKDLAEELNAFNARQAEHQTSHAREEVMRAAVVAIFMSIVQFKTLGKQQKYELAKAAFKRAFAQAKFRDADKRAMERAYFHFCGEYVEASAGRPSWKFFVSPRTIHPKILEIVKSIDRFSYSTQFTNQRKFAS